MKKIILVTFALLVIPFILLGQSITLNNIGMYVDATGDSTGSQGETVHMRVNYSTTGMDNIQGPYTASHDNYIRIYWYSTNIPDTVTAHYLGGQSVQRANWVSGGIGLDKNATFEFTIPTSDVPTGSESFQVKFGLYGEADETLYHGTQYTSYIVRGSYDPCAGNPPANYFEYIDFVNQSQTVTVTSANVNDGEPLNGNDDHWQPVLSYQMQTNYGTTNLTDITINRDTGSTAASGDFINNGFKLYESSDASFSETGDTDLGDKAWGDSWSWTGLSREINTTGKYYFFCVKMSADFDETDYISTDINQSNITISNGTVNTFSFSSENKYLDGFVILSYSDDYPTTIAPGADKAPIFRLQVKTNMSSTTFTAENTKYFGTAVYDDFKADGIKIYEGTDPDVVGDNLVSSANFFSTIDFTFTSTENVSTTPKYYWITVDVASDCTIGHTITAQIDGITTGYAKYSESFPMGGEEHILPVELSIFTAQYLDNIPTLYWVTQSETDNIGWYIYRNTTDDFGSSDRISDLINGYGTTTEPHDYIYHDKELNTVPGNRYWYWIQSIDLGGKFYEFGPQIIAIPIVLEHHSVAEIPKRYGIHPNFPNPFGLESNSTNISFTLPKSGKSELAIYNIRGELVKNLYNGVAYADDEVKDIIWDGRDKSGIEQSTGVYLLHLKVDGKPYETKKVIIMR